MMIQAINKTPRGISALPARRLNARCMPRRNSIVAASSSNSKDQAREQIPAYFQAEVPPPSPPTSNPSSSPPDAYQAIPTTPIYPPPTATAPEPSLWSQIPPLIWIGIGVLLANAFNGAMAFMKGGPQKMQEMAMQQMMNQMMKQAMKGGAPGGGASPFGGGPMGGFGMPPPPAATGGASSSPFGGFPSGFPSGSSSSSSQTIDTTATPAAAPVSNTTSTATESTATTTRDSATTISGSEDASKRRRRSAFVDVDSSKAAADTTTTSSPSSSTSTNSSSTTTSTPPPPPPPFSSSSSSSTPPPAAGSSAMLDMLKDPKMQEMLYPYLPEPMRNPETFEWMLNNPEYRAQLEQMIGQQGGMAANPAMADMLKDIDMSPDKMQAQFDQLGMTPDQFIQKVMGDPDLSGMMTNPRIMTAIAECSKDPMNIFKYQNDEEVMKVFEKLQQMVPGGGGAAMGMPNFPSTMTPPPPPSS